MSFVPIDENRWRMLSNLGVAYQGDELFRAEDAPPEDLVSLIYGPLKSMDPSLPCHQQIKIINECGGPKLYHLYCCDYS